MSRNYKVAALLLVVLSLVAVPPGAARAEDAIVVPVPSGFVPVAIWEVRREGFPAVRHAWVVGTETMLRVSWDDGATWFGFRPLYADAARGLLALRVAAREELGRGEVAWVDKVGVTLLTDQAGQVTITAGDGKETLDVSLEVLSVREESPAVLQGPDPVAAADDGGGIVIDSEPGGGGPERCCVTCEGVLACDCSVCIPACHASCCAEGCFCQSC
jgi:hypothetical protein